MVIPLSPVYGLFYSFNHSVSIVSVICFLRVSSRLFSSRYCHSALLKVQFVFVMLGALSDTGMCAIRLGKRGQTNETVPSNIL